MAETQNSPVLLQYPSPPHILSPDINLLAPIVQPQPVPEQPILPPAMEVSQRRQEQEPARPEPEVDTPMPEAPTSEAQPETIPEPQPSTEPQPTQTEQEYPPPPAESAEPVHPSTDIAADGTPTQPPAAQDTALQDALPPNPEEQPSVVEAEPEIPAPPEWVTWEDDTSVPSEEELKEMKELEGTDANQSALNVAAQEKKMFLDWPDPDQRPIKKIRLSWVIKGVRGTKERPNMARTMHSPAALIDGKYWQIKFFPRGNKNDCISAYIRCTPNRPIPDPELPESTFAYFEGPPDANVGEGAEPKEVVKTEATPIKEVEKPVLESQPDAGEQKRQDGEVAAELTNPIEIQEAQNGHGEPATDPAIPTASQDSGLTLDGPTTEPSVPVSAQHAQDAQPELTSEATLTTATQQVEATHVESNNATNADVEMNDESSAPTKNEEDFRLSAQLGMVIYNPEEPRTSVFMSSEHQFNKYNDDWGWTNFVPSWKEIHIRKPGQFQPLLKNDTLAIDAYILIFDDPTQALWWHESNEHESIWPSKKLAGYYPMGTQPLYHSPLVAGLTSWLLLEPFRKVLQGLDAGQWRANSQVRPKPLVANLQHVLHKMRHLTADTFVNLGKSYDCIKDFGESYTDVVSFWEVLRRSIELEIPGEQDALAALSKIFDVAGNRIKLPSLPVKGVKDIQQALQKVTFPSALQDSGPDFLPLVLKREVFDQAKREWKLHHDRVVLNDEIELPGSNEKYTLYGFVAHVGERSSQRFYSILRPNGPKTKWLAFEDGEGNKIFSYTNTKIKEYEGIEGEELPTSIASRQTAYLAMYIKSNCLSRYLPGSLEDYSAPSWIGAAIDGDDTIEEKEPERDVDVEVYHDGGVIGHTGLLDMLNMKNQSSENKNFAKYNFSRFMTFYQVRRKIAEDLGVDDVQKLRMFVMRLGPLGQYSNAQLETPKLKRALRDGLTAVRPFCLWCTTLKTEEDVKLFGYPDKKTVASRPPSIPPSAPAPTNESYPLPSNPGNHTNVMDSAMTEAPTAVIAENEVSTVLAPSTDFPNSPEAIMEDAPDEQTATGEAVPTQTDVAVSVSGPSEEVSLAEFFATMEGVVPTTPATAPGEMEAEAIVQDAPSETLAIENLSEPQNGAPAAVEHGHLVDAVMSDSDGVTPLDTATSTLLPAPISIDGSSPEAALTATSETAQESRAMSNEQEMADTNDAVIAALIATDAAALDNLNETSPPNTTEPTPPAEQTPQAQSVEAAEHELALTLGVVVPPPPNVETGEAVERIPSPPPAQTLPVFNVYGFLQIFDANKQVFTVHSTFFGKRNESVKDVVRRCLGYDKEKAFHVWHRESTLDGVAINDKVTFEDIQFIDGVDVVVGEILSEEEVAELRKEGKYDSPFALSRYLRMRERNHPTLAATTSEFEISDFGSYYYLGPLVNGQRHGDKCTLITAQGNTYNGPLVMSQKSGSAGKMTYANGDTYEGAWINDERHGEGTFVERRTGNTYVGGFMNGKRWGKGTTTWEMADEEADMCQICYGEDIDALFFDCGHVCACVDCAKQCSVCPICRKEIKEVVKMYWA